MQRNSVRTTVKKKVLREWYVLQPGGGVSLSRTTIVWRYAVILILEEAKTGETKEHQEHPRNIEEHRGTSTIHPLLWRPGLLCVVIRWPNNDTTIIVCDLIAFQARTSRTILIVWWLYTIPDACGCCCWLMLSHINSCKHLGSVVTASKGAEAPRKMRKPKWNQKSSGKCYTFPPKNAWYEEGAQVK